MGPLARLSFGLHAKLADEFGANHLGYRALSAYSVSLRHTGAAGASAPARETALAWLGEGEIAARRPQQLGGPTTLAQTHPRVLTRSLLTAAQTAAGTTVRPCAAVGARELPGGGVEVQTRKADGEMQTLRAGKVVLAMGPWSIEAQRWFPKLPAIMAQKYASVVVPVAVPPHALFTEYADASGGVSEPEMYPRQEETYVCKTARQVPLPKDPGEVGVHPDDVAALKGFASAVAPALKEALAGDGEAVAQACYLPLSPDSVPLIGRVAGTEAVFVATGHSCWGILNSPATGLALAELIVHGKATSLDLSPFNPSRFGQ